MADKNSTDKKNKVKCKECGVEFDIPVKIPHDEAKFCNECMLKELDCGKWTLSDERAFFENLFAGRFNFFLIAFSLFVSAGFANNFTKMKYLVFYFGAFLLFLCWLTLLRALVKFDLIFEILFNQRKHPIFILQKIAKNGGYKPRFNNSRLMGVYIPFVCILFLIVMGILINIGVMN